MTPAGVTARGSADRVWYKEIGMVAESEHHVVVAAWMQAASQRPSAESLIRAFETSFAALWARSHVVLGEVTLGAILDRVLHNAVEQFPVLASVERHPGGLRWQESHSHFGAGEEQVAAAIELVLIEFLTVLGNLTAQILTPALHAELAKAS